MSLEQFLTNWAAHKYHVQYYIDELATWETFNIY